LNLSVVVLPQSIYIGLDRKTKPGCAKPKPKTAHAPSKYGLLFLSPLAVYTLGSTEFVQTKACNALHFLAPTVNTGAIKRGFAGVTSKFGKKPSPAVGYEPYSAGNTQSLGVDISSPGFVKPMTNHKTTVLFGPNAKRASNVRRFDGIQRTR
jgi:hypothetical protein